MYIGDKLPICFILKAAVGGVIERTELDLLPKPHMYVVQKNAWQDDRSWAMYLTTILKYGPVFIFCQQRDSE
jgi:hypothetical protein